MFEIFGCCTFDFLPGLAFSLTGFGSAAAFGVFGGFFGVDAGFALGFAFDFPPVGPTVDGDNGISSNGFVISLSEALNAD